MLLPDKVDPHLKLTVDQKEMTVRIDSTKGKIEICRPDQHFLARWWVNGKPFFPQQVTPIPEIGGGSYYYPHAHNDALIHFKIDPKKWGATPGDLVEVQMLYCPARWLAVRNPQHIMKGGQIGFPRLTNKASFKTP